ncbi:hypothetical protein T484DRAFT_1986001 [Baffinella frigidus]|nr:hypothetical protein T484DRAFT_1986001 [Cryptophyta sp. CCMP2293]
MTTKAPAMRRVRSMTPTPPCAPPREPETIQDPSYKFLCTGAQPDLDWLNSTENVKQRATPRVFRKTPIRPRARPEHLAMVLKISKRVPMHIDEDDRRNRRRSEDLYDRPSVRDFLRSISVSCPTSPMGKPTLEFKVRTVRVPDFAWLNSTDEKDIEEPAARRDSRKAPPPPRPEEPAEQRVSRKPPPPARPTRAPPRPFEQKAEQHGGRTWEEYAAALTRLLQSSTRAETCVGTSLIRNAHPPRTTVGP